MFTSCFAWFAKVCLPVKIVLIFSAPKTCCFCVQKSSPICPVWNRCKNFCRIVCEVTIPLSHNSNPNRVDSLLGSTGYSTGRLSPLTLCTTCSCSRLFSRSNCCKIFTNCFSVVGHLLCFQLSFLWVLVFTHRHAHYSLTRTPVQILHPRPAFHFPELTLHSMCFVLLWRAPLIIWLQFFTLFCVQSARLLVSYLIVKTRFAPKSK